MTGTPSSRHLVERAMELLGAAPAPGPRPAAGSGAPPPPPPPPLPPAGPATPGATPAADPPPSRALVRPAPIGFETLRRAGLVSRSSGERTRPSEELKVVQQQVLRAAQMAEPGEGRIGRLVMITSARPGEGKTFCALNIAAYLALSAPEQVILVDGDGKTRDTLSHLLGQAATPGLRLLANDLTQRPETLLVPTALDRLSFLSYGPPASDAIGLPSGVMLAAALGRLAAALPGRIIILDTPPCLATSEPGALAPVAGQVVMVVEAERTQRGEVEGALDMVESCPTLQLLLNRTRMTASDTFGAYGYYGE